MGWRLARDCRPAVHRFGGAVVVVQRGKQRVGAVETTGRGEIRSAVGAQVVAGIGEVPLTSPPLALSAMIELRTVTALLVMYNPPPCEGPGGAS